MNAPGVLAVRTINQYRRRDVLAYLGLRYYLANSAARSDRWAREVAPDLVLRRGEASYLTVQHFKEVDMRGNISHREIFLPTPNEALAETALLDECGRTGGAFVPASSVFSYRLATGQDTSGPYRHYMNGLRQRHAAIAEACRSNPGAEVTLLDIRRFYPSIGIKNAERAWISACESSGLAKPWLELGMRLLHDHGRASGSATGHLLTGPMFSHIIGNLLLRHVDQHLSSLPARYFRYVDDVTLVGSATEIERSVAELRAQLDQLGLELHDRNSPKSITVSAETWLQSEHDYTDLSSGVSWMTFIGDLKRLLLIRPDLRGALVDAFQANGFRIPVPDYSAAVQERAYRTRILELLRHAWFRRVKRAPSIQDVVGQAMALRSIYAQETAALLKGIHQADPFHSKRLLPKLRYRFGRLAYLGNLDQLAELASAAESIPTLRFQGAVAKSIATGDVGDVIEYGVNAAQAAAQPLRMRATPCVVGDPGKLRGTEQSLAVLRMNGLAVPVDGSAVQANELLDFANAGASNAMMRSGNLFIRELACLHGITDRPRHDQILDTAFDQAEDITLDAIEQDNQSS